jgi:hypothetical protein
LPWQRPQKQDSSSSSSRIRQQESSFNFASYVARLSLVSAMQLLQEAQQQLPPQLVQQQQQRGQSSSSSSSSSSSEPANGSSPSRQYSLAISGSDLRACLTIQSRDAFVDLEDVGGAGSSGSSSKWQLGVYELDSGSSNSSDEDDREDVQSAASAVAACSAAAGHNYPNDSAPARKGRFRWGMEQQQQQQQQQQEQNGKEDLQQHCQQEDKLAADNRTDLAAATYTSLPLPGLCDSSSSSSSRRNGSSSSSSSTISLQQLALQQQQDEHLSEDGEVSFPVDIADVGVCDKTPVFQIPGLQLVLDTNYGEVMFSPAFLSLSQLMSFFGVTKSVTTQLWINDRREQRKKWRQGVETAAVVLAATGSLAAAAGSSSGSGLAAAGGRRGSSAAAAAAAEESEEDDDGMGDPPEAKALLEELGEAPASSSSRNDSRNGQHGAAWGFGLGTGFKVPTTRGLSGALNSVALGTISLAAGFCCGLQELMDRSDGSPHFMHVM